MRAPSFAFDRPDALRFLFDLQWWKNAFKSSLDFAPFCAPGAIGLGIANVLVVLGSYFIQSRLKAFQSQTISELGGLLFVAIVSLLVLIVSVSISLWALSFWLFRLTAYARVSVVSGENVDKDTYQQGVEETAKQKSFVSRVWLWASLYLLVPVVPLTIVIAVKMLLAPEYNIGGAPMLTLPPGISIYTFQILSLVIGILCSIVALAYSLATVAMSSQFELVPGEVAMTALKQCLMHPLASLTIATVIFVLNVVVGAPYLLMFSTNATVFVSQNPVAATLAQIWLAATSVVLWPLSVSPFLHLLRTSKQGETNVS